MRGVVLTGSVFEADEGAGDAPLRAFSPYGVSKGLTAHVASYWCSVLDIPLGKFVIPNPFGPFEEPRFCSFLIKTWREGKPAEVRTPDYVRDNIHVDLLAKVYAAFAAATAGRRASRAPIRAAMSKRRARSRNASRVKSGRGFRSTPRSCSRSRPTFPSR